MENACYFSDFRLPLLFCFGLTTFAGEADFTGAFVSVTLPIFTKNATSNVS